MSDNLRPSFFKKPVLWIGVLMALTIVLAACAPAATPAPTATTAPTAKPAPTATPAPAMPTAAMPAEATINVVADAKFGKILVDGKGMTLYMFTKDEANKSNCAEACLKNWPPLLTLGSPKLGEGVDKALIGTAALPDGSKIVTYNKMPLYYWVKDAKAGDATGLGVNDAWYLVAPDGKVVGKETSINLVTDPKFGKILVDGKGMTLYMFTKDEANKSNCAEACLKNWPPLLTLGSPKLGEGVDKALIGSAALPDGSKIVTYNKMPLYYWVKDAKAGDMSGLGVNSAWYFVSPEGKVVGQDVVINVANDPKLGKILVDGKGLTLYMFTKDEDNKSNCNAECLKAWPPFITQGSPKAGEGVDQSLIGFTTLADGSKIVTYKKMPLYYWVADVKPGDTTGQGVNSVWYVLSPEGKIIGK